MTEKLFFFEFWKMYKSGGVYHEDKVDVDKSNIRYTLGISL